jgi:preprotein translocase subunit SecE
MADENDNKDENDGTVADESAAGGGDRRSRKKKGGKQKREFDPSRWAHLIFVLGGFMAAWVLAHAIEDIWAVLWSYYPYIGRAEAMTSNIAGISIALAGTIYAWRRRDYFKFTTEVVVEISQVTWPTRPEIRAATIVVIVLTLICSVLLFAMDQVWSTATNLLYGI